MLGSRLLLAKLGVSVEDLVGTAPPAPAMPTLRVYVARVADAVPPATLKVYGTYWRRVEEPWGDRFLDEPTPFGDPATGGGGQGWGGGSADLARGRTAAEHIIGALGADAP